jgi:hypothetical protein
MPNVSEKKVSKLKKLELTNAQNSSLKSILNDFVEDNADSKISDLENDDILKVYHAKRIIEKLNSSASVDASV